MSFPFFFNRNGARKLPPYFRLLSSDVKKRFGYNTPNKEQTTPPPLPAYQSLRKSIPSQPSQSQNITSIFANWTPSTGMKSANQFTVIHPIPDWESMSLPPIIKNLTGEPRKTVNSDEIADFRQFFDIELTHGFKGGSISTSIAPVFNFEDIEWPTFISEALRREQFENPTPIQSESWPILLKGHNYVGVAETGSGKTLAYSLPALFHLTKQQDFNRNSRDPKVLIIVPVRELAMQIGNEINKVAANTNIRAAVFTGGERKGQQLNQLRYRPQVIVATPGRLIDLTNSRMITLSNISYLVLDEADRLLDMGFSQSIRSIKDQIRPDRQVAMFTATWPKDVRNLARDFMGTDFIQLTIGSGEMTSRTVSQHIEICQDYEKEELLNYVLEKNLEDTKNSGQQFKVLIFCNRKGMTERVASVIEKLSFVRCSSFHGDIGQEQRQRILQSFRDGKFNVLIASDAAARGLDVKNISLVVNFEFPLNIETYIHRIGRTGRAGAQGHAISFLTPEYERMFGAVAQMLKQNNQPVPPELTSYLPRADRAEPRQKFGQSAGKFF